MALQPGDLSTTPAGSVSRASTSGCPAGKADVLTYRYGSRLVYVAPAESYEARISTFFVAQRARILTL